MIDFALFSSRWIHRLMIVALLGVYLWGLATRGLAEPDEGRYAGIALEMLEPGADWWDPQFSDIGHYDKPPLVYWVSAVGLRLFGHYEWAVRLPSLLGFACTLLGLGWASRRLYPDIPVWIPVGMAATTLHLWICGQLLTPDMLMTGFTTLAIAAWAESRHRGAPWWGLAPQILFWTLAFWTKATPALVPFTGLMVYTLFLGDRNDRNALRPWIVLPSFLLLGLPWFLYIIQKHPDLVDFFLHRELVGRMVGHEDGRRGVPGYHVFIALLVWLPWWPVAVVSAWRSRKLHAGSGWHDRLGPESVVAITGVLILSFVSSKLPTYILPMTPWAVLAFARRLPAGRGFRLVMAGAVPVYLVIGLLAQRNAAALDKNSSMRPLVEELRSQGATGVISRRHFSGLEFYWGDENLAYLSQPRLQISSDAGSEQEHFFSNLPEAAARMPKETWLIELHRDLRHSTPPPELVREGGTVRIGDFVLIPLRQDRELHGKARDL